MALISVLMVLLIIMIVASAFAQLAASDVRTTRDMGQSSVTLYLAEAGVEYAMWMIKHNMDVYPRYDYDYDGDDSADAAGSKVMILAIDANDDQTPDETPQEHVVINDLAYDSGQWLDSSRYCGTFQVYQLLEDASPYTKIHIVSVGRVRQVPSDYTWDASNPPTQEDFDSDDWAEVARRTLNVTVRLKPLFTSTDLSDGLTQEIVENLGDSLYQEEWYEEFR
ncbi:MAG TPA: pilus assembly PilX N-terminal domain-containing protein [Candidatus Nitrosotenuis sp.]|nr:pilus assembly PilX N-terminal domain-containing protein [Candidatus Nitrosotenuis sp.]